MKNKLIALVAVLVATPLANATVTLSGTALKNVGGTTLNTDLPTGMLGLLLVDTTSSTIATSDGFIKGTTTTGNPVSVDPLLSVTNLGATMNVGDYFAGDLILARLSTSISFGDTIIIGGASNVDIGNVLSHNFAILWFNNVANSTTSTSGLTGSFYGLSRGGDWTLPGSNSGTFTFNGTSGLDQLTLSESAPTNGVATVPSGQTPAQSVAFATPGTTFQIIPEPSAALLGAIGVLGLLRRRRN